MEIKKTPDQEYKKSKNLIKTKDTYRTKQVQIKIREALK